MSDSKQIQLKQAAKRAAQLFERQQQTDRRIAEEEKRHSEMLAKTTRLREQRLARDAVASAVAKNEEKSKTSRKKTLRKRVPKTK